MVGDALKPAISTLNSSNKTKKAYTSIKTSLNNGYKNVTINT